MTRSSDQEENREAARGWWQTAIIDMVPGEIRLAGYPIEDLIGNANFPDVIWLMLRGELPSEGEVKLLQAALVAAVDHGPQAPSIATARMAMTCGVGLNNAMASAVNMLGDIHGGAGEQAVELYLSIDRRWRHDGDLEAAVAEAIANWTVDDRLVPGFGHRFHPVDPRAPRLLALVDEAVEIGTVEGRFAKIARSIEHHLEQSKGRRLPLNIDGASAVIFAELGFAPPLARGLFILSRSVGILAHAWEQKRAGGRIKGPLPPDFLYRYDGPPPRRLSASGDAGDQRKKRAPVAE